MAHIGKNQKWTLSREHRETIRALFEEGLDASRVQELPGVDLYQLGDGHMIGVQLVDPDRALGEAELALAPWLEFEVEDVEATASKLAGLGLQRVEYHDREHHYFKTPGGIVFRLAAAERS